MRKMLIWSLLVIQSVALIAHAEKSDKPADQSNQGSQQQGQVLTDAEVAAKIEESSAAVAHNDVDSKLESLLENDLVMSAKINTSKGLASRQVVTELPSDTYLYNYTGLALNLSNYQAGGYYNSKSNRENYSLNYVVNPQAVGFWDLANRRTDKTNAGIGLYLAIDPFASSSLAKNKSGWDFGSNLVELTIAQGTKVLSVNNSILVSNATISQIRQTGAVTVESFSRVFKKIDSNYFFTKDTLKYMVEEGNEQLRKVVHNIFLKNNIQLIDYGWQTGINGLCGKGSSIYGSALVFVGAAKNANNVSDGTTLNLSSIKSITMIYTPLMNDIKNLGILTPTEVEAFDRYSTLYPVLRDVREMDLKVEASTMSVKQYSNNISVYNTPEINQIKQHLYKCSK